MTKLITWSRFVGYQCSTKGDARFSAFNARLSDGRTIEEHYQCDVKGYDVGGTNWRLGKGKPSLIQYDGIDGLYHEYLKLWAQWAKENPELIEELYEHAQANGNVLADMFATTPVNQARALADILNTLYIIGPIYGNDTY